MPTPSYEFDSTDFETDEGDKRLLVQFFTEAVKDEGRSAEEGRPIFKEVVMVRIITPGSRDVMVTRASDRYKQRFPRQWERFQKMQDQTVDGTPLDQVPFLTVGQIAELKAINCFTLEQLAGMSDQLAQKMMGMHGLRQKATAFLQAAKDSAPLTQMQAELEKRDNEIALLKAQLDQLVASQKAAASAAKVSAKA